MKLGEGVQIVRGVTDLNQTIEFYEKLGYVKLDASNTPNNWALFTDGRINLLLDEGPMTYTGLIYFNPQFDETVKALETQGIQFMRKTPKTGDIPESAIFLDPSEMGVNIVNAPYKSPKPDLSNPSKVRFGKFGEFALSVKDVDAMIRFWTNLGYTVELKETEPQPWAILIDDMMVLGFHQEDWGPGNNVPTLTYFDPQMETILNTLQQEGLPIAPLGGTNLDQGNGVATAPDGLRIFLFKADIP